MKNKKSGIYCIKNTINGKFYIGSSIDCYKRRNRHFSELRNNKHKNKHLQNAYNKHSSFFIFGIIEIVEDISNLIKTEQFYIDKLKPKYNINLIANSSLGVKRSEETKEKIRKANLGLKHPQWRNDIKSIAQGGSNHWTKNKKFSEKSKKKMSNSQKKLYKEGYISPLKGIKLTKERKMQISKSGSIPINQFDKEGNLIRKWNSATEASNFGFISSCINQCINNKRKTHKNFIWKKE